jgi:hypothetical protein
MSPVLTTEMEFFMASLSQSQAGHHNGNSLELHLDRNQVNRFFVLQCLRNLGEPVLRRYHGINPENECMHKGAGKCKRMTGKERLAG